MAIPSMVSQMLEQVVELTNVIWVARMGNTHFLASIGMANAFVNMFGYSIMQGLITAFYTLAS